MAIYPGVGDREKSPQLETIVHPFCPSHFDHIDQAGISFLQMGNSLSYQSSASLSVSLPPTLWGQCLLGANSVSAGGRQLGADSWGLLCPRDAV